LEGQNVILDDRIGKEVLADGLKLSPRGSDIVAFQFQLDTFADMGLFNGGNAEVLDGAANSVSLRIKDAFAWADDDLGSDHVSPYRLRTDWKTFLVLRTAVKLIGPKRAQRTQGFKEELPLFSL
jgi:hypothetical protein